MIAAKAALVIIALGILVCAFGAGLAWLDATYEDQEDPTQEPDDAPTFTRDDVKELRHAADYAEGDGEMDLYVWNAAEVTRSVADRIEALLPPEEE